MHIVARAHNRIAAAIEQMATDGTSLETFGIALVEEHDRFGSHLFIREEEDVMVIPTRRGPPARFKVQVLPLDPLKKLVSDERSHIRQVLEDPYRPGDAHVFVFLLDDVGYVQMPSEWMKKRY